MELLLGDEETLIKNWEYAELSDKVKGIFTITDKRVIFTESSKNYIKREEIELERIVGLSTSYLTVTEHKRKAGAILLILGIITVISVVLAAVYLNSSTFYAGLVPGAVLIGLGLFYLIYKKTSGQLKVVLQTTLPTQTYKYGLQASNISNTVSARAKVKKSIILKVNLEVANEIVNTLGSVVLVK